MGEFVSFISKKDCSIGLLVHRKNIPYPIVELIKKELLIYIFEAQVMLKTIDFIQKKQLFFFDGHVGDAKCQTRASMLLDLFEDEKTLISELNQEKIKLLSLINKINNLIINLRFNDSNFIKKNLASYKYSFMSDFIEEHQIYFTPSSQLLLTSLCHIIHLTRQEIKNLMHNKISINKIDKLRELAKMKVCQLSVEYEQNLALKCGSSQDCKILNQIESKHYSSAFSLMTACFPSFKLILEKIKQKKQPILLHKIQFCTCGGTNGEKYILFKLKNKIFVSTNLNEFSNDQAIITINSYQFAGSFAQLKTLLNIPADAALIDYRFRQPCMCKTPTVHLPTINFEEIILGYFVQHPQFITNAEIDWKGLGLENSDLKKEFDHLKTIPGCSNEDMSVFCIKHVYASTIADVLKEQEEMEARLQAEKK